MLYLIDVATKHHVLIHRHEFRGRILGEVRIYVPASGGWILAGYGPQERQMAPEQMCQVRVGGWESRPERADEQDWNAAAGHGWPLEYRLVEAGEERS
ncbi:hypothetical protein [Halomonas organivorans]|uniref:Uncharacterized protein n=1 Tax=Halomonas organivorans TaxID=257772 RepID=A0A7W5G712_9GAMM|nr:hypothetical protein [Halomonas organivorans]MBB3142774.1 hypothetical protein [Halomonas organivorans]